MSHEAESEVSLAATDAAAVSRKRSRRTPDITKMRLEAVFHPKFENEKSDTQIRQQMLVNVAANKGYLEVSLKHSGSLVLWSGGQRFYSKNSTDNAFTMVGEILLMQHFARCYRIDKWRTEYDRCSEYLHQNRLTCSFELVTSMLGQHGDVPIRDYLILIAVADRDNRGRFYSTNELVAFAHQYRLPHNDFWVFTSKQASEQVFIAYDSLREEGTTTTVINSLNQIVAENDGKSSKVASLYPHDIFQGDILEGIVIRYVHHNNKTESAITEMEQLRITSDDLLAIVPPSTTIDVPPLAPSDDDITNSIVHCDLRKLADMGDFEQQLRSALHQFHGVNQRQISSVVDGSDGDKIKDDEINLPCVANEIMRSNRSDSDKFDQDTIRLAQLIEAMDSLNIHVTYKLLTESSLAGSDGDRKLCIIHVHHDASFQKYNKYLIREGCQGMELFRGFCIELISDTDDDQNLFPNGTESNSFQCIEQSNHEEKLMLKMKFLPYMVRTFICRNGLSTLRSSGSVTFEQYAIGQLTRWEVSDASMTKWLPFFKSWSLYCTSSLPEHLPPLTSNTYLQHYKEFENMYDNDHFSIPSTDECLCRGLIVLVGISKDVLESLAAAVSKELNCQRIVRNMAEISERDVLLSVHQNGNSIICLASVEDDLGNIRKLSKSCSDAINIVHVGNVDDDLEASLAEMGIDDNKRLKKLNGMAKAWRKAKCNNMLQLPRRASMQSDVDATVGFLRSDNTAKKVMQTIASLNQTDDRPGLIIYFPSIPGSGKSALCSDIDEEAFASCNDRSVIVKEGDAVKGKFYNEIEKDMLTNRIAVLDKNVPPISFSSIHSLCSASNCISAAVLPAGMQDTVVGNDVYPFSLEFLATCMNRVLGRKQNSHIGKLDSATKNCCMIVAKFYCFYRRISVSVLRERLLNIGTANEPIEYPFFQPKELPSLPEEVKLALEGAINILAQDINCTDVSDAESAMRLAIQNNQTYFDDLTLPLEHTKQVFNLKLSHMISSLPDKMENRKPAGSSQTIKIASLDFDYEKFCSVLDKIKDSFDCVKQYFDKREGHKSNDENDTTQNRFIRLVHCTFAHNSQVTQSDMMASFNHLLGCNVNAKATALLYSDNIAAIEVEIPQVTSGIVRHSVPRPRNEFQHVTVWCGQDVEAKESNELPEQVAGNLAKKILFNEPISLCGSFSFWYEQEPDALCDKDTSN